MLHSFVKAIRQISHPSGFDGYLNGVHRRGQTSEPTVDEARKDYRAAIRHGSHLLW